MNIIHKKNMLLRLQYDVKVPTLFDTAQRNIKWFLTRYDLTDFLKIITQEKNKQKKQVN